MAIIFQGVIASVFLLMSFIGASAEQAYLVLVDATIIVYFIPYIYIFLASARDLYRESRKDAKGKHLLKAFASAVGGITTVTAIVLALFPPQAGGNPSLFFIKTLGGSAAFVLAGMLIFWFSSRRQARIGTAQ